ncbi:MAG: ATP-binding cassette domain-containing protein, partial [Phycisphaerae bacterium]
LKAERELSRERAFTQQQAYIAKQEEYIRRFGANQRAMQARGRKTRLERLKDEGLLKGARKDARRMILNLKVPKPSGHDALKVEGLSKAFPNKELFKNIEINLERGKRLGIIGPNGSGKTTLLNILAQAGTDIGAPETGATADSGKIKWGYGVALKYYQQEHQDLNPRNTIIDELQEARITAKQQELHDLAALFLFSGDTIEKKVEVLSGGEKARVSLAKLLMNPANTILMDEPTNHLDMATAEVLENALDTYDGTLVLVSHDRYFMDQVCDMLLVLQPGRMAGLSDADSAAAGETGLTWKLYSGSYTEYLAHVAREKAQALESKREEERRQKQKEQERQAAEKARQKAAAAKKPPKVNMKYAKLSLQQIEEKIMGLESKISSLEALFGDPKIASDPAAMADLQGSYKQQKRELAEINAAWEAKAAEN